MRRVAVFIDGSNLYHGMKHASGSARIDLHKLASRLARPDDLVAIYYYTAELPRAHQHLGEQLKFLARVRATPQAVLRLGRLEDRGGCLVEKGVDVMIALDMLEHAFLDDYDMAILVSGDGDFVDVVRAVRRHGKAVRNAYFKRGRSSALAQACRSFIRLTPDTLDECRPD